MFLSSFYAVDKPNLINLQAFPFKIEGGSNIISRVAEKYRCIGAILLNDKDGNVIAGIAASKEPCDIMYKIFYKWLQEDTECCWEKLMKSLRRCELSVVAQNIEDALRECSTGLLIIVQCTNIFCKQ